MEIDRGMMRQTRKESLEQLRSIISGNLCHRCGSCAGICPRDVIAPDEEYFPSWEGRVDKCTDCGLCVQVCAGADFSFPEHSHRIFGREVTPGDSRGIFIKTFLGHATDPATRQDSTSGGMGTKLPAHLLATGKISGAFTVVSDPEHPWKPKAVLARNAGELKRSAYSKYPACSMNHLLGEIRNEPGPFLYTGLPCQIHGLRKMEEANKTIGEKVGLVVGLICHSCLEHRAITEMLRAYRIDEKRISGVCYRVGKLPGYVRAITNKGEEVYLPYPHVGAGRYRPNAKEVLTLFFKFHSPRRCRMCVDAMAEFSDISIGDPWIRGWQGVERFKQGYNLIIARTERGLRILEEVRDAGAIALEPFDRELVMTSHEPMATVKRLRGFYNIEKARKRGLPFPEYGFKKQFTSGEKIHARLNTLTYVAADRPRLRNPIFRFLLSRPGRFVVGFSFFRRRVLVAFKEKTKNRWGRRS